MQISFLHQFAYIPQKQIVFPETRFVYSQNANNYITVSHLNQWYFVFFIRGGKFVKYTKRKYAICKKYVLQSLAKLQEWVYNVDTFFIEVKFSGEI